MTVHADLGGRDVGERGILDGGVAVSAIDTQASYVMLVTKGTGCSRGTFCIVSYGERTIK
jgi:acyl-coenzyme A thioesterase PaaI-like protein